MTHFHLFLLTWFLSGAAFAKLFDWREMQNSEPYSYFRTDLYRLWIIRTCMFLFTMLLGPLNIFMMARSL